MLLLNIRRDVLLKPLQSVIGIVERRHTLPILSNILIEKVDQQLILLATDLEIQISAIIDCENKNEDFAITVSAKKLLDICRAFNENAVLAFDRNDNRIRVKSGKSLFTLQTLPAANFPKIATSTDSKQSISIPQNIFKKLLDQVQYAMAQQDLRYYLNGLLLTIEQDVIKVVATDGHRLAIVSHKLPQFVNSTEYREVILPRKTIIELIKLLEDKEELVNIEISNQVKFKFSNIEMISKIVEKKFPDYNKVIPIDYKNSFIVERIKLLQSLQRVSILSNEKISGVRLVLTKNNLSISCNNIEQEEAEEALEIVYEGNDLDIGFNIKYILDVLNNIESDKIICSFGDINSSALITIQNDESFKYVVMPMRI